MPGAADYSLQEYTISMFVQSIGTTPTPGYLAVPMDGEIVSSMVTPYGAIATANATLTVAVLPAGVAANAVNVGGVLTVLLAGAAAGTVASVRHSGSRRVVAGDSVRVTPAGATGAAIAATVTLRIRR